MWVRDIFKGRKKQGVYNNLVQEMQLGERESRTLDTCECLQIDSNICFFFQVSRRVKFVRLSVLYIVTNPFSHL